MVFTDAGLAGREMKFTELDDVMQDLGFIRWTWDYDMAIYEKKYRDEATGKDYYLRIRANAIKGRIEERGAVVKLEDPVMARHIEHHGMDYEAEIPQHLAEKAEKRLNQLKAVLV